MLRLSIALTGIAALFLCGCASTNQSAVQVDPATGNYLVNTPEGTFSGTIAAPIEKTASDAGVDSIGGYHETSMDFHDGATPLRASIRFYYQKPVVLFTLTYLADADKPAAGFPNFTSVPPNLHILSHTSVAFAPTEFVANQDSTPWLLFDDSDNAAIISPADHFFITQMSGDGVQRVGSELNPALQNIPAGFSQQTILAAGTGINSAYDTWGKALTDLHGTAHPASDADTGLKYLGYWTDNGSYYYYKYDQALGYAGTLLKLADYFREKNIPVRYMQLDSWWYYKTFTGPDGKEGKTKQPNLPPGEWNRYGGLMEYRAVPAVFPDGLAAFQKKLGMPLITHNRWVDPKSPYQQKYKISGFAGIDPGYWDDIEEYLKSSGVETYEQDWLSEISRHSPGLSSTVDQGDAFLNGMADAAKSRGMTMQYCMAMPWDFLQGVGFSNLTTVRVSDDRFDRSRWRDFFFTSRLASALGEWPWTDTYNSTETYNVLLSNLSAGMVGFGDKMGKENRDNLMKAVRADGVIVKPDASIVPTDSTYIAEATGKNVPLIASTFTDHDGIRTEYVFACHVEPQKIKGRTPLPKPVGAFDDHFTFERPDSTDAYVYDYFRDEVHALAAGSDLTGELTHDSVCYDIIAPVGKSGIAFFGDEGKFVSTGKQRIASMDDQPGQLIVHVLLSAGESEVTLHGAGDKPLVTVDSGTASDVQFDPATTHWSVKIESPDNGIERNVTVTFTTKQ